MKLKSIFQFFVPSNKSASGACLLIDYENLILSLRKKSGDAIADVLPVLDLAMKHSNSGRLAISRAYADWRHFNREADALMRRGVKTIQAPSTRLQGKNGTDIQMAIEATVLAMEHPGINPFILVTGDSDFLPLIELLHEKGHQVIGVGVRGTVSPYIVSICDAFYYFDDLKQPALNTLDKKPARKKTEDMQSGKKQKESRKTDSRKSRTSVVKEPPKTYAASGTETAALEALGIDPAYRIPPARLRTQLALARECVHQAHPRHIGEMKQALRRRFPNQVQPNDAATLAPFLHSLEAYGTDDITPWLLHDSFKNDDLFDIMLFQVKQKLASIHWADLDDSEAIAKLVFGIDQDRAEMNMRIARGKSLMRDAGYLEV